MRKLTQNQVEGLTDNFKYRRIAAKRKRHFKALAWKYKILETENICLQASVTSATDMTRLQIEQIKTAQSERDAARDDYQKAKTQSDNDRATVLELVEELNTAKQQITRLEAWLKKVDLCICGHLQKEHYPEYEQKTDTFLGWSFCEGDFNKCECSKYCHVTDSVS